MCNRKHWLSATDGILAGMTDKAAHVDDPARQADAVMRAARVLIGVVAKSLVELEDQVSLPQWRVLVLLATKGRLNLGQVAGALGVHPSNATRTVDRLVVAGFIKRADDPQDRRYLVLDLTKQGHDIVEQVMGHRRASIVAVMENMTSARRRALARAWSRSRRRRERRPTARRDTCSACRPDRLSPPSPAGPARTTTTVHSACLCAHSGLPRGTRTPMSCMAGPLTT